MLTVYTGKESRSCEGLNRRNFIQAGALGMGGLTLSTLLETQANAGTLALAGGGLKMGQVIGRSDRKVSVPATTPVTPLDLTATVVNTLVDIPTARLVPNLPLELTQFMSQGQPISQLM